MTTYIWTHHALRRLKERHVPKKFIEQTLANPDRKIRNHSNSYELQKIIAGKTFAAIIKTNGQRENIIVSVWVNPPFPGTKDYRKRQRYLAMKQAPLVKKLWLRFLNWIEG